MKYSDIIYIIIILIFVSFFYIPQIIKIFSLKEEFKDIELSIEDCKIKKIEYQQRIKSIKNKTEELQHSKEEEIQKLKKLSQLNYLYMEGINEEKSDLFLTEKRNEEMKALIKIYENSNISSYNKINILRKYFQSNKLIDYLNNKSNILLLSSIIKDESDIDFIYNQLIYPFYNHESKEYIIGFPCYKTSMDSNDPSIFHKRCKDVKDSIMLIKTNKTRLGAITEISWGKSLDKAKTDFVKTKTRMFNLDNRKVFLYNKNQRVSRYIPPIRAENYYLAIFGYNDLYLGYLPWECNSDFPQQFLKSSDTNEDFNDLMNQKIERYPKNTEVKFEYQEIEVYPIIKLVN